MPDIEFSFDPSKFIGQLELIKTNIPKALRAVGVFVLGEASRVITDGSPDWAAWKTIPSRPHQMLWETGTLLRSLTVGGPGDIFDESDNQIIVGSNVKYAASMQYGNSKHGIPARPFFVFNSSMEQKAGRVFMKYLMTDIGV